MRYQDHTINDSKSIEKLSDALRDKNLLIVGPGVSVKENKAEITKYITENKPVIISINYVPSYIKPNYVFLSNAKRYVQLATTLSKESYSIIATSNVTSTTGTFDYVLNISSLLDRDAKIIDNSLVMFLKTLIRIGVKDVVLAGFDGYSDETSNYFRASMEYEFIKGMADYLNQYTTQFLDKHASEINATFLTHTKYRGAE